MNWTLEVVVVPVSDIDRAKAFYEGGLGFHVDHDVVTGSGRLVQLTPPGSGCSIVLGPRSMPPGSLQGVQLVVNDLRAAHADLVSRGVDVGEIRVLGGPPRPATPDDPLDNVGFVFFRDPDGNGWAVQQIGSRP
ncbi:catechol 2,3-dioxygenase-like lactoylglutathione lyase family enzyme [Deinococcus metalli]|uniref:Catechol 2,3-dioxygenase-like lactoylglutathione lyase family enzyme n=1 Tax=Deinococcus metalli TaxID=1141878 RepID=A0A7W8KF57_9DEIO|nr:VOC family protein [Deinococcus metalli]MBB5376991.1 catechol 2,3-dioxygenase-like lactoylglutathione lyase family enzyme [Deinococcus metalli]GHF46878.1 glyoxalase [Deinococcus metalli]